jgi:hypothetical protein
MVIPYAFLPMALIYKKNLFPSLKSWQTVILGTVNEDPAMVKFLLDAGVNYQVGGSSGFLGQLSGRWVVWVLGSTIR